MCEDILRVVRTSPVILKIVLLVKRGEIREDKNSCLEGRNHLVVCSGKKLGKFCRSKIANCRSAKIWISRNQKNQIESRLCTEHEACRSRSEVQRFLHFYDSTSLSDATQQQEKERTMGAGRRTESSSEHYTSSVLCPPSSHTKFPRSVNTIQGMIDRPAVRSL